MNVKSKIRAIGSARSISVYPGTYSCEKRENGGYAVYFAAVEEEDKNDSNRMKVETVKVNGTCGFIIDDTEVSFPAESDTYQVTALFNLDTDIVGLELTPQRKEMKNER